MPAPESSERHRIPEFPVRLVAIGLGGALGTLARWGVGRQVVDSALGFPWATFVVNMAGSFLLGVIVTLVVERFPPTRYVRPFAAIGFCGGFTTFSALAVDAVQRAQHGRVGIAALYLVSSLVGGIVAAGLGIAVSRGFVAAPGRDQAIPDPDSMGEFGPGGGRT